MNAPLATQGNHNSTRERAIKLLGNGISIDKVALAIGVTEQRIHQLLAESEFVSRVQELRYQSLQRANDIDESYQSMEERLIKKFDECIEYMVKPGEILSALQRINKMERRGSPKVDAVDTQKDVVTINMPIQIIHQFTTNINNEVVQAGTRELITMQSGKMKSLLENHSNGNISNENSLPQQSIEQVQGVNDVQIANSP